MGGAGGKERGGKGIYFYGEGREGRKERGRKAEREGRGRAHYGAPANH